MNTNCSIQSRPAEQVLPTLGVRGVRGFVLEVPDLGLADVFLSSLGLDVEGNAAQVAATLGDGDASLVFEAGSQKRLRRVVFSCLPEDRDALGARASARGATPDLLSNGSIRISDPDGIEIEIVPRPPSPGAASSGALEDLAYRRCPSRSQAGVPKPRSLSHVAIFVTDVDRSLEFYTGVVGLALSDRCGDALAFLHSPHGSDHHVLALVKSGGPGLHHYSLDMGTVDAIELRAAHLAARGYSRGWGLGRHVLGSNFFHYIRDPWGSHAELTAGLEYIHSNDAWVAGDHPPEDAFYLWGPPPPEDFAHNPEAWAAKHAPLDA